MRPERLPVVVSRVKREILFEGFVTYIDLPSGDMVMNCGFGNVVTTVNTGERTPVLILRGKRAIVFELELVTYTDVPSGETTTLEGIEFAPVWYSILPERAPVEVLRVKRETVPEKRPVTYTDVPSGDIAIPKGVENVG